MFFDENQKDVSVSVTLEECNELAEEMGARNGWELASRFAAKMLPQIFRIDSPVFELEFALEHQRVLEDLVGKIPSEVFLASDSLGWVYQFWQTKQKDVVNQSVMKIGEHELPAVTQLFTEPYMVQFLLDNSIGAWWANHVLSIDDYNSSQNEINLREKAAIDGVPLEYLRFVKDVSNNWQLACGTYRLWPDKCSNLKILEIIMQRLIQFNDYRRSLLLAG